MGANADHHEPGLPAFRGPVLVGRRGGIIEIGVAGDRVSEVVDRHGLRLCNLLVCPVADEDRLAAPHHRDRLPHLDIGEIDLSGRQAIAPTSPGSSDRAAAKAQFQQSRRR